MTKAEAKAWKERWRRVNEFEIEELRNSTPERDLRQLATLMAWPSAEAMGEPDILSEWDRMAARRTTRGK
jgi:hypothetical protein